LSKLRAYPTEDPQCDELNIQFFYKISPHNFSIPNKILTMSEHTCPLVGRKDGCRIIFRRVLRCTLWGQAAHENTTVLGVMNISIPVPQI